MPAVSEEVSVSTYQNTLGFGRRQSRPSAEYWSRTTIGFLRPTARSTDVLADHPQGENMHNTGRGSTFISLAPGANKASPRFLVHSVLLAEACRLEVRRRNRDSTKSRAEYRRHRGQVR